MKVLVFKSGINSESEIEMVAKVLEENSGIHRWSVDLEDIDKILRIESVDELSEWEVVGMVKSAGIECEELPD